MELNISKDFIDEINEDGKNHVECAIAIISKRVDAISSYDEKVIALQYAKNQPQWRDILYSSSGHTGGLSNNRIYDMYVNGKSSISRDSKYDEYGKIEMNWRSVLVVYVKVEIINWIDSEIERLKEDIDEVVKTHPVNKSKEDEGFFFENNFNDLDPKLVYDHFYKMVDKGWLSDDELKNYLVSAFEKEEPLNDVDKIDLKNTNGKRVAYPILKALFGMNTQRNGAKRKFAKLLSGYFKTYDENNTYDNFNK